MEMKNFCRQIRGGGIIISICWLTFTGCETYIGETDPSAGVYPTVEVPINIEFAEKTQGTEHLQPSAPAASADHSLAFSVKNLPTVRTKTASGPLPPDQLYNLEIQQYDQAGNRIGGMSSAVSQAIGSSFTVALSAQADCQLVIVAWGEGNTSRLGTSKLEDVQKNVVLAASSINSLRPLVQADMNKMPYVLHLPHVKIIKQGDNGILQSVEGNDIRIRLRRLAVRLNLRWDYAYPGYQLSRILLRSIPLNYKVVPRPDVQDQTYPSLLDQFTTIELAQSDLQAGTYACWLPANVRGTNPAATSAPYRTKQTAPMGSSYASFMAVNNLDAKKKLDYRLYLGGPDPADFNLYGHTDYTYQVNFRHTDLPVNDERVTIIDPIPASENNNNLLPAANCFMVAPGSAFCFNPYRYHTGGTEGPNTLLQTWCGSTKIQSVKVLWQTLENGDVGDPVLGVVNSAADHTNIVDLKNGDNFTDARIYCRIAPNTTGGSGVIAAYDGPDGTGNILWSWHIWVTEYSPSPVADESVDEEKSRVQKYTYGNRTGQYPLMDRNLGAMAGYVNVPENELQKSKTNGFHYQWGRKEPFPSSYTDKLISSAPIYEDKPSPMMLNLYGPDGYSFFKRTLINGVVSRQEACRHPTTLYSSSTQWTWCSESGTEEWWGGNANAKTVHDPCPAGWRVAGKMSYFSFFQNASYAGSSSNRNQDAMNIANGANLSVDGGVVLYFEGLPASGGRTTYVRLAGYQERADRFSYIGKMGNMWCRERDPRQIYHAYALTVNNGGLWGSSAYNVAGGWSLSDAHPVRCTQDR